MADQAIKHRPDGTPVDRVFDNVRADVISHDQIRMDDILLGKEPARVRLFISGGLRGEEYLFDLAVDSSGKGSVEMTCDLSKRCAERQELKVDASELVAILKVFEPAFASREVFRQGGFPPCSLIGRLEIEIGGRLFVHFFMADPGQAETAGYKPPPYVLETTDALYRMAERQLGIESVRP